MLQARINHTVDLELAMCLLVGSVFGAQLGAKAGKKLAADRLKILLAIIILAVMGKMLAGMLIEPSLHLSFKEGWSSHPAEMSALPPDVTVVEGGVLERVEVNPDRVEIGAGFNGEDVRVTAEIPEGAGAVFKLVGLRNDVRVQKKEKVKGLFWIDTGVLTYPNVPMLCQFQATAPISQLVEPASRHRFELGLDAVRNRIRDDAKDSEAKQYVGELVKLYQKNGLFSEQHDARRVGSATNGKQIVEAHFHIPDHVAPGPYELEVYEVRNGEAIVVATRMLPIEMVGTVAFLSDLARDHGLEYGLLSVGIALLAGSATGFMFGKIGRKGKA